MATNPLLTLLLQAMMAMSIVLLFIFGAFFCGVYVVLVLFNSIGALVNGYRQQPPRLWLLRRAMIVTALIAATLICSGLLFCIDGRLP